MTEKKGRVTKEEFLRGLDEYCKKAGWVIAGEPRYLRTNHNTYETVIIIDAIELPDNGA